MINLLLSKFETYLLDEELDANNQQDHIEAAYEEPENFYEYPPGFFSSL
ncbi:hypothetical protein [Lysinibacillus yapensis]|nr:hypothetical protein [Lysinibacillus yapensis]